MTRHYTDADMKELARFYNTPVGKKSLQVMPQITADAMAWSMERVQAKLPALLESIKPPQE